MKIQLQGILTKKEAQYICEGLGLLMQGTHNLAEFGHIRQLKEALEENFELVEPKLPTIDYDK